MKIYVLDCDEDSCANTAGLLLRYADVELVGRSAEPSSAVGEAAALGPDALFVDARLGAASGLTASERIRGLLPNVRIVYVTASRDYAVAAFEQRAFDYLLKPLNSDRLDRTIGRLRLDCGELRTD
ncbi:response regulator [Saccharibacillus sp. CPCC 101409]|uniref:LytR/AlgR family response regulator transcription factor n=1 Tax=Saccharibacillus sp. CPCC 101409 TaxID=3058041 RepID=UPI0026723457|nr:response regulator [Saccharibacillus sp. CPCC 101409]MDO3410031.1 response regulator [Saccharibacillus sp. CPCC 101409]